MPGPKGWRRLRGWRDMPPGGVRERDMKRFGLVGSFSAQPGQGDGLADVLVQAAERLGANPECELYVISRSPVDPDAVWVAEVWTSREAHQASLEDQRVRELITQARPLIAGLGERFELLPLGGKGLPLTGE
jgi:quinol monooxygenase YgiN